MKKNIQNFQRRRKMKDLNNNIIDLEALRILKNKFVNLELLRSLIVLNDNKDLVKAKRKTKFIDCNRVLEQYNDKSINELEPDELDLLIIWLNEK